MESILLSDESGDSASDSEWCKIKEQQQEQDSDENESSDNSPPPTCSKKSKLGKKFSPEFKRKIVQITEQGKYS